MERKRDPWLIARLFDLSFSRFVTLSLIRIVYVILMIAGLVGYAMVVTYLFRIGDRHTTLAAVLVLLLGPIIYLAYLLILRLVCETLIVLFAMAEDLEEVRQALERNETSPSGLPREPMESDRMA
jgi:Domain of unknown function (DUF4282)